MKTTPIFVIGSNRSGTTFLGNVLASSSSIAAVQYEVQYGIHESSYFNHIYGRYGDIKHWSHYVEFVEATINSDFFSLTGVTREELYQLYPASYSDVFRFVMDRHAGKQGATYWVEKSPNHSLELELIAQCYPDALFIATKRELQSVVKSALGLNFIYDSERKKNRDYRKYIIKDGVKNYYRTYKSITAFAKKNSDRILQIRYEDLLNNEEETIAKLKAFIGLKGELKYNNQFAANSSFQNGKASNSFFEEGELSYLRRCNSKYRVLPLLYFVWKTRLKKFILSKTNFFSPNKLPTWFYRSYEFQQPKK